jgi:hypothetical protein
VLGVVWYLAAPWQPPKLGEEPRAVSKGAPPWLRAHAMLTMLLPARSCAVRVGLGNVGRAMNQLLLDTSLISSPWKLTNDSMEECLHQPRRRLMLLPSVAQHPIASIAKGIDIPFFCPHCCVSSVTTCRCTDHFLPYQRLDQPRHKLRL